MPNLQQRAVLDVAGKVRVYLKLEVGIIRGEAPGPAEVLRRPRDLLHEQLASRDREISWLRARLAAGDSDATTGGIPPEHLIWVFGVARTGSSWLGAMMGDLDDHAMWYEPYVGDVFGYAYYMRAGEQQRGREDYILGDPYRGAWIHSIRNFVLEGANARFPDLGEDGYLIIKEPNGSVGAPLLAEALPESRVILLVRDPRDVVASLLAAQKEGSWCGSGPGCTTRASGRPGRLTRHTEGARLRSGMRTSGTTPSASWRRSTPPSVSPSRGSNCEGWSRNMPGRTSPRGRRGRTGLAARPSRVGGRR